MHGKFIENAFVQIWKPSNERNQVVKSLKSSINFATPIWSDKELIENYRLSLLPFTSTKTISNGLEGFFWTSMSSIKI